MDHQHKPLVWWTTNTKICDLMDHQHEDLWSDGLTQRSVVWWANTKIHGLMTNTEIRVLMDHQHKDLWSDGPPTQRSVVYLQCFSLTSVIFCRKNMTYWGRKTGTQCIMLDWKQRNVLETCTVWLHCRHLKVDRPGFCSWQYKLTVLALSLTLGVVRLRCLRLNVWVLRWVSQVWHAQVLQRTL